MSNYKGVTIDAIEEACKKIMKVDKKRPRDLTIYTGSKGMELINHAIELEPWLVRANCFYDNPVSLDASSIAQSLRDSLRHKDPDIVRIAKVGIILKENGWD